MRTLIVDDSESFLAAARDVLKRSKFEVVGDATTAAQALRLLEDLRPDLILLDIYLGGQSGLTLSKHLADHFGPGTPAVVLISTYPEEEFADLIAESPAVGFIAKQDLSPRSLASLLGGHERVIRQADCQRESR